MQASNNPHRDVFSLDYFMLLMHHSSWLVHFSTLWVSHLNYCTGGWRGESTEFWGIYLNMFNNYCCIVGVLIVNIMSIHSKNDKIKQQSQYTWRVGFICRT